MERAAGNFLIPSTNWVSLVVIFLVLFLTFWPLAETAVRRRWGWFWSMFLFGPFAGLAWILVGRNLEDAGP